MATNDHAVDDIQARVLQTTLKEISSSRQDSDGPSNSADCCVICLDAISEPCTALPCAHTHFDVLCLLSWLEQRSACPLCKANVYKVRYKNEKDNDIIYRVPNASRPRNIEQNGEQRSTDYLRRRQRRHSLERDRGPADHLLSRPAEAIERRRHVYRRQLYSLRMHQHLGRHGATTNHGNPDVGSNRHSQYRLPPTPTEFSTTPHLVSRARLWIRRELQVFSFLSDPDSHETVDGAEDPTSTQDTGTSSRRRDNAEFLLEYIIAILKTVDMQGSAGQAEDMLSDFLGRNHTRLFLHELRNWLRSPSQSLIAWDREVKYDENQNPRVGPDDNAISDERPGQRYSERSEEQSSLRREGGGDYWRASGSDRKRRHRPHGDMDDRPTSRTRGT
ncbi:hypothetical protein OQA88_9857 [Cercophora sp. LCS_1]